MRNGLVGTGIVFCCCCSLALAETSGEYFDDATPNRFDYDSTFPPGEDNRFDDNPSIELSGFRYQGFADLPEYQVSLEEIRSLVRDYRDRLDGRFQLEDLNDLTADLTRYYRDRGLILARVIVPEQRIEEGRLTLMLILGQLEAVEPVDNDHYDDAILRRPFDDLIGQAVQEDHLQAALLRLSDYPGVAVETALAPGEQPGTTRLMLNVRDETPLSGTVGLDNQGDEETGRYRFTLAGRANNPLGRADALNAQLRIATFPANSVAGQLGYRLPLDSFEAPGPDSLWRDTDLTLALSASRFSIGGDLESLNLGGRSNQISLGGERTLERSRTGQTTARLSLHRKQAESDQDSATLGRDNLAVLELGGEWRGSDRWLDGGRTRLAASVSRGLGDFLGSMDPQGDPDASRQGASGDFAGSVFTKWRAEVERLQALGGQFLSLRGTAQYSPDLLTSLEQQTFGGLSTVRGYPGGDRVADSAVLLNAEYYGQAYSPELTLPVSQLRLGVFWDAGWGWLNDAFGNEESNPRAMSVGGYTAFTLAQDYQARLDLGVPISDQLPSDDSRFRIHFSLSRTFD